MPHGFNKDFYVLTPTTEENRGDEEETCQGECEMTQWQGEDDNGNGKRDATIGSGEEASNTDVAAPASVEPAGEMAQSVIGARVEEVVKEPGKIAAEIEPTVPPPDIVLNAPEPVSNLAQSDIQQTPALVQPAPKLRLQIQPSSPTTQSAARKSPVTVQEWVDSIPAALHRSEEEGGEEPPVEESDDLLDLGLGAEAGLLYDALPPVTVVSPAEPSPGGSAAKGTPMLSAHLVREPSIQSDVTSHTGSHCSSVESYLESRRPDPEEILLNLGFGGPACGAGGVDSEISRIPRRFLQPSKVRGVAIDDFLRYQQDLVETFESGFCGYRGLTGSSHTPPSVIVAKIMEKLREHDRENIPPGSVVSAPPITNPVTGAASSPATGSGKFSRAARRVLTRTAVLGALPVNRQQQQSVLTPDNRRFLDSQGSKSPEVPRKRMIIGHRSFTIGCDGEDLIELEPISHSSPVAAPLPPKPKPLVHKDSVLSTATSLSLTSIDSDSDTDDRSSSYGQLRLPPGNTSTFTSATTSEHQPMLTHNQHIGVGNKRFSSTSLSSWESEAVSPSRSAELARKTNDAISKTNTKQHSRFSSPSDGLFATSWSMKYESIHEDMETKSVPSSRPHSSDSENELSYSSSSGIKGHKVEPVKEKDIHFRNMGDIVSAVIANKKSKLMRVESSNSGQYESCCEEMDPVDVQGSSLKKLNTTTDIEESVLAADRKKIPQEDPNTMLQIRRGSLKRQQHVEDDDATVLESSGNLVIVADSINVDEKLKEQNNEIRTGFIEKEGNSAECLKKMVEVEIGPTRSDSSNENSSTDQLQVANMEQRGDSFEMEEICVCGDDEAGATKLLRARSDSSGFLDGDSETSPARLAANGTSKLRAGEEINQYLGERNTNSLNSNKDVILRPEDTALLNTTSDIKNLQGAIQSPLYCNYISEASQGTKQSIPNSLFQELKNTGNWSDNDMLCSKQDVISEKICNLSGSSLGGQSTTLSQQKHEHKDANAINVFPGYENNLAKNEKASKFVSKSRSHDNQCHEEASRIDCSTLKHNVKIKDTCRLRTSSLHCIEKGQLSLPGIKRTFSAPYCLHQLHTCDTIARHGSQNSLHNMFSSCSDVSVIQCLVCGRRRPSDVGDIIVHLHHRTDEQKNKESSENETTNLADGCPAVKKSVKDLSELMTELKGRGWEIAMGSANPHFASHTDQQLLNLQGDAVRAGLAAYGHQLMGTKANQDRMCDISEAQKDLQNVNEVRNRIASELRHIANLLEEQPPQRADSITSQMAMLLSEQARLFQQLEADDEETPSTACAQPTACCLLLDAVRKENQYLQSLVEKNTRELSEIRQMLQDLVAQKSGTKQS